MAAPFSEAEGIFSLCCPKVMLSSGRHLTSVLVLVFLSSHCSPLYHKHAPSLITPPCALSSQHLVFHWNDQKVQNHTLMKKNVSEWLFFWIMQVVAGATCSICIFPHSWPTWAQQHHIKLTWSLNPTAGKKEHLILRRSKFAFIQEQFPRRGWELSVQCCLRAVSKETGKFLPCLSIWHITHSSTHWTLPAFVINSNQSPQVPPIRTPGLKYGG